jgi:hypothetical protein
MATMIKPPKRREDSFPERTIAYNVWALAEIKQRWQRIIDCECGGWCDSCCDTFAEIGELAE